MKSENSLKSRSKSYVVLFQSETYLRQFRAKIRQNLVIKSTQFRCGGKRAYDNKSETNCQNSLFIIKSYIVLRSWPRQTSCYSDVGDSWFRPASKKLLHGLTEISQHEELGQTNDQISTIHFSRFRVFVFCSVFNGFSVSVHNTRLPREKAKKTRQCVQYIVTF